MLSLTPFRLVRMTSAFVLCLCSYWRHINQNDKCFRSFDIKLLAWVMQIVDSEFWCVKYGVKILVYSTYYLQNLKARIQYFLKRFQYLHFDELCIHFGVKFCKFRQYSYKHIFYEWKKKWIKWNCVSTEMGVPLG